MNTKALIPLLALCALLAVPLAVCAQDQEGKETAQQEIVRLKAEIAKLKAEITQLKAELARNQAVGQAADCKVNRGYVASACSLDYARLAVEGKDPAFPKDYKDPKLYADGKVPECPAGGKWTYDPHTGRITACSIHGK